MTTKLPKKIEKNRCPWCLKHPIYISYHDEEWGVPVFDDRIIFEFLLLESAQAGLSWLTVLKKRQGYREAFADFNPIKVAKFNSAKMAALLSNPEIIRNRLKIEAAVNNAKRFLEVQKEFGSFANYMWGFVDGKTKLNRRSDISDLPATSSESDAFAKDLKKRGFKFLGSTTIYAHMQAVGMVNDHLISCHRYKEVQK
ncbi:MAG: DNA-3-methyladenine glycosylase I [Proteobacteria bacterium]|nr:DNA-3-methyladenine glycosylase I [Pseudomonadota bacterium]